MNPLRVRATNYRTFDDLDLELPEGCVAVIGGNGAGKSSVVNLIDLALFGAESRSLADCLTDSGDATELAIELTFEHAGDHYRVRRSYSARGRGKTTVDLERHTDHYRPPSGPDSGPQAVEWEPLTCESAKDTDALICRTVGLSRATFRASAYLAQGDGAAFTDAPAARRKEILAEVLGLDLWANLQELAKRDRRTAQDQLQRVAGETSQATALIATKGLTEEGHRGLETVARETQAALIQAETRIGELEQAYRAAADTAGKRKALDAQLESARSELKQLRAAQTAATEAETAIAAAQTELAAFTSPIATDELVQAERDLLAQTAQWEREETAHVSGLQQARTAELQRETLLQRETEARERFEKIRAAIRDLEQTPHGEAHCDRCGQILAGSARALAVESLGNEANGHAQVADQLKAEAAAVVIPEVPAKPQGEPPTAELADVRRALATAQAELQQRARLEERISQLQHTITLRPAPETVEAAEEKESRLVAELADLEPVDIDAITRQGETARRHLADLRARREDQVARLASMQTRLDAIVAAERQLAEAAAATRDLQAEINLCLLLEAAYGRDGIPALILENSAIPYIETESARILAELGGTTAACRIELRTQAALKTGDGLRDTLDVVIVGEQGERAYETFSGGERTRINLALRIALARLLAHRRGAESRLLAVDEPEFLDEHGTSALAEVLRGLQDDFDKLYVISHVPSLRDSFDSTIEVTKPDAISTVTVDGVPAREAVAV